MTGIIPHPSSYRDPSGFVYVHAGKIYRQVNKSYANHYKQFITLGLYQSLCEKKYILPHEEINENILNDPDWQLTLLPQQIPFINYPSEWCFEQLKDAALLTLQVARTSIDKGMILKDATPFNVQFINSQPVFIDTLSFEILDPAVPWIAYRQFCESFLFPLLIAHYNQIPVGSCILGFPDGIPVSYAAKLLPFKSKLNAGVWLHVILQNKLSGRQSSDASRVTFSSKKMINLIDHLTNVISKLQYNSHSVWKNYYTDAVTDANYLSAKEKTVREWLSELEGEKLLDLGANNGYFSLIAAENKFSVIALDNDEHCINSLYKKNNKEDHLPVLPLCISLMQPTAATGFANKERSSFHERAKADVAMALALIHHLRIGNNVPLTMLASYFASLAPQLIIEFVPKEDEKTQLLLRNKKDIYPDYTASFFENVFSKHFRIEKKENLSGSGRTLYLMKRS